MALKPEASVIAGATVAGITIAIYQMHLPSIADSRQNPADDGHLEAARRQAAWWAAGMIGLVSLLTQDPNVFIIGGSTLTVMDYMHKHSNQVNPDTGKIHSQYDTTSIGVAGDLYAVPDNGGAPAGFSGYANEQLGAEYGL
jgi:hypothetical protein